MSMEILALSLCFILAGLVQGTLGFGFGISLMSLLPFFMSSKDAVVLVCPLSLVLSTTMAFRLRKQILWPHLKPLILGTTIGVPIGVNLFSSLNPSWLLLGLGLALLLASLQQLWLKKNNLPQREQNSSIWGILTGLTSGILGGAFNTSGPPILLYVGTKSWSKEDTMALLQVFFSVTTSFQAGLFLWNGIFTTLDISMLLWLLFPSLLGMVLGFMVFRYIDQEKFRIIFIIAIALLGLVLIYKSGYQLLG